MSKLIRSTRLRLIGAVVTAVFVASQAAAAAPTPTFGATCQAGETTTASWTHFRPDTVTFTWSTPNGSITNTQSVPRGGPPRRQLSVPSPDVANSVHVDFSGNGGGSVTVPCSI